MPVGHKLQVGRSIFLGSSWSGVVLLTFDHARAMSSSARRYESVEPSTRILTDASSKDCRPRFWSNWRRNFCCQLDTMTVNVLSAELRK